MADALLSPAVGGAMWVASGAAIAVAARKVSARSEDRLVPLMGVLGAFVFAVQMINFAIPGTGSSGHLGGGLLLAILLGPWAGLLVVASVLAVQALFFADGGLLALGANLFNVGVLPCLVAYPLLYRPLAAGASRSRRTLATVIAAVAALQLGALCVVLQTAASDISSLPAGAFLALMLPIHLAIGLAEGLATAALVSFLAQARPDLLPALPTTRSRPAIAGIAVATALVAGVLSWFASPRPDGLEWSLAQAGTTERQVPAGGAHERLAALQSRTAVLPDYALTPATPAAKGEVEAAWPDVSAERSFAGLVGALATVLLVAAAGFALRRRR